MDKEVVYTLEYHSTIKKNEYIGIHNRLVPSHKKEWNNAIYNNMDRRRDNHTKWSKSLSRKRKTNAIWYHLHVEPNTWHKWTYPWNRNQLTDIENRPVVAKRRQGGRGKDWESGINRCKQLFIKWINNKVLSHSREIYSISYNKPQRKRILYNMNHFAVQQKLTHYKSTIIQCLCGSHTTLDCVKHNKLENS